MSYSRKKRFINKSIQGGLTGAFITVTVVGAFFQVVLVNRSLAKLAGELGEPEVFLQALPSLLVGNLAIAFAVLLPAMWFFGVHVTHRIAGPAYRFEMYLEEIARGEYKGPCKIRSGDEFQGLCDKLNLAVERLRADAQGSGGARDESQKVA